MDRRESDVSATDIATSTKVDKLPIEFTIFPSVTAQSAKRERGTWEEVVERLRNPAAYPRKEACPLIKLATFGDRRTEKGAVRHDGNVLEVFGIEADYDAEKVGMDRAADLLTAQGIEAFLYTTPSHVADRPRWRVLAPLSKPHAPAERERLVAMLNSVLGGKRCEMYGVLRDALPGLALPQDEDLAEQLTSVEYGFTPSDQIALERKTSMKARGLASPDLADALALTYAYPVPVIGLFEIEERERTRQAEEFYMRTGRLPPGVEEHDPYTRLS